MGIEYFTCVTCGGLVRQQTSESGGPWLEPQIVWVVPPPKPCPHPWWDEGGAHFEPVPAEAAATMIAAASRENPSE